MGNVIGNYGTLHFTSKENKLSRFFEFLFSKAMECKTCFKVLNCVNSFNFFGELSRLSLQSYAVQGAGVETNLPKLTGNNAIWKLSLCTKSIGSRVTFSSTVLALGKTRAEAPTVASGLHFSAGCVSFSQRHENVRKDKED